jgi:hypothetical protein
MSEYRSQDSTELPGRRPRWVSVLVVVAMFAAILFTYRSPGLAGGHWRLFGLDYVMLHNRRVDFAVESLAQHGRIAAWYPRELMGTPFWSNVQSFPLLPTRMILLVMPGARENLFTIAVYLSLLVSSGFTYLFTRRAMKLGAIGAAAAGFTFACCGYFVSRTLAGQLGMLESYSALPLLLYLAERFVTAPAGRKLAAWTAALAVTCGAFAVSAHPQHPIYGVVAAAVFIVWRCAPAKSWRRIAVAAAAMMLGIALPAAQLYPMAKLIARSSRTLPLDAPANDIAMPYDRLWSLLDPWRDGAPVKVNRPAGVGDFDVARYGDVAYFWDTINYIGWIPLLAAAALAGFMLWTRRPPSAAGGFIIVMGIVAFALSLPIAQKLLPAGPFIILRSPARMFYFVSFALSLACGGLIDLIATFSAAQRQRALTRYAFASAAVIVILFHAWQLYCHARAFVQPWEGYAPIDAPMEEATRQIVGDGRIGIDKNLDFALTRRIDDVGFFDSIMLAHVYRSLIDLNPRWPENVNVQELDGGQLSTRSLLACGVRLLFTAYERPNVQPRARSGGIFVYQFPDAAARVTYFPAARASYLNFEETRRLLRQPDFDVRATLLLPPQAKDTHAVSSRTARPDPISLGWRRPAPDRIEIDVDARDPGFVRILEAHDIGWRATVDGRSSPVYRAHNMVMAVPIAAGQSQIVLEFFTPGAKTGLAISTASLVLLGAFVVMVSRGR